MTNATPAPSGSDAEPSDAELLAQARSGDADAFAALYRRHHRAALSMARRIAGENAAEDTAAEALTRMFALLRDGGGPHTAVRAYLAVAIRNLSISRARKDQRLTFTDEVEDFALPPLADGSSERADLALTRAAFDSLAVRDRTVLWWTTVEGLPAEDLAQAWGRTPQAIRQQAYRAREALRLAYLEAHVQAPRPEKCASVIPLLPRRARGTLSQGGHHARRVESHVDGCEPCSSALIELEDLEQLIG